MPTSDLLARDSLEYVAHKSTYWRTPAACRRTETGSNCARPTGARVDARLLRFLAGGSSTHRKGTRGSGRPSSDGERADKRDSIELQVDSNNGRRHRAVRGRVDQRVILQSLGSKSLSEITTVDCAPANGGESPRAPQHDEQEEVAIHPTVLSALDYGLVEEPERARWRQEILEYGVVHDTARPSKDGTDGPTGLDTRFVSIRETPVSAGSSASLLRGRTRSLPTGRRTCPAAGAERGRRRGRRG